MMDPDQQTPDKVLACVDELRRHDGFAMYCHRFECIKADIIKQIVDTGVGDQDTHDLKQQLSILERLSPASTLTKMRDKAAKRIRDYDPRTT